MPALNMILVSPHLKESASMPAWTRAFCAHSCGLPAKSAKTFQNAVAVKLVHDERSIDVSRLLDLVGDDATHEVRMSRVQIGHQFHQGFSVGG